MCVITRWSGASTVQNRPTAWKVRADYVALPGFTFGLDIILLWDSFDCESTQPWMKSIALSQREMLFLFEAYTALLRAGTEVSQDAAWKEEVRENKGLLLSIDGIQPDRGNETIYQVRDVFTGRIVTAENVTESTKECLKEVLAPVVALGLPVVGVISDAQSTQLQAVAELWPAVAHQICQFHALREAVLNVESHAPFDYGGPAMQEALTYIHTSLERLEKQGER